MKAFKNFVKEHDAEEFQPDPLPELVKTGKQILIFEILKGQELKSSIIFYLFFTDLENHFSNLDFNVSQVDYLVSSNLQQSTKTRLSVNNREAVFESIKSTMYSADRIIFWIDCTSS